MACYKFLDHPAQGLFLTINLKDQLLPGSFEFTLNYLIDHMDLSAFDAAYHNDAQGASAYPPACLLKMIIYCYSKGIITSRPIEYAAKTNRPKIEFYWGKQVSFREKRSEPNSDFIKKLEIL
jgi:transposase